MLSANLKTMLLLKCTVSFHFIFVAMLSDSWGGRRTISGTLVKQPKRLEAIRTAEGLSTKYRDVLHVLGEREIDGHTQICALIRLLFEPVQNGMRMRPPTDVRFVMDLHALVPACRLLPKLCALLCRVWHGCAATWL